MPFGYGVFVVISWSDLTPCDRLEWVGAFC